MAVKAPSLFGTPAMAAEKPVEKNYNSMGIKKEGDPLRRWGIANSAILNENGEKTLNAYDVKIPEVGERPTQYAENIKYQGKSSAVYKAEENSVNRFLRPLAAMLVGFFVGSAGTLAIYHFSRGMSAANEQPLLAVV